MKLSSLLQGKFLKRYKRFFADVELTTGEVVTAHCANPGSMKTLLVPGADVWISISDNPKRKLKYTWEIVKIDDSYVCVNTHRGNHLVEEALRNKVIAELAQYEEIRAEVKVGTSSRIDFCLQEGDRKCYVEVKSTTMAGDSGICLFPDSVTKRGTKHANELAELVNQGNRAVLLFCCNRTDANVVQTAREIDPTYADTVKECAAKGVEVLAYRCVIDPSKEIRLADKIDVDLL